MDPAPAEADGIGEVFVSPEGPGTGPREPLPEELELLAELEGLEETPAELGEGLQGEELKAAVEMLEGFKEMAAQGKFETWQRMVLMWGLRGLDVDLDWPPQPYRAAAAVAVVGGSCLMEGLGDDEAKPTKPEADDA